MDDSNATELLRKLIFDIQLLEWKANQPGSYMTLEDYSREEAELLEKCAQAVAATLGAGECEIERIPDVYETDDYFRCRSCHEEFSTLNNDPSFCPNCRKAVKR